ncbi:integration host factor, actinobacterial type [Janibacter cremeus]|uniref:integration host factor, actinobacterial type n=1 Tax=Janibacter cremeus TaxID=1285192 RepID=UPI0023F816A7|nr:integration host factor, actinobacterial type [Janibacter cremeus]WEV79251.1 integration host factor, actinobacterial type [Janibacter cremeus]
MVTAPLSVDPGVPVPVPTLSPQQRAHALARATSARQERAVVKRRLKEGSATIGDVLADGAHDPAIAKLRVLELLESMPGIGDVKAGRIMDQLRIARSRRVRGLGPHQARALVEWFERS